MNRLHSTLLLGTFAAAGAALAIGVGLTAGSTPGTVPRALAFPRSAEPAEFEPNEPAPPDRRMDSVQRGDWDDSWGSCDSGSPDGPGTPAVATKDGPPDAASPCERHEEDLPEPPSPEKTPAAADDAGGTAVVQLALPTFVSGRLPEMPSHRVAPARAYAEQFSVESLRETVQQVMDELRRDGQPGAQAEPPAFHDSGGSPFAPERSAPRPPDLQTAPSPAPANDARIRDEGGGLLTIHIQNEDIRRVLELLGAHGRINILASPRVQGTVSATLSDVSVEDALDAILRANGYQAKRDGRFVFVGTASDFVALEQSFDRLTTRIFRPNYITASELQKLISPLLTEGIGVSSVSTPAESGIAADGGAVGGDSFAGAEAVVVRDYETVLLQIDALVAEVDVRPLQVHIEAMILSVALKEDDEYGVNWQFLRDSGQVKFGVGDPAQTLATFDFERGALKVGFLDRNLGAFLTALESIGDTSVIASPRLLVLNKQRANIQIGDQKGYVSTTVTETVATETIEFMETGTILRIRPFISTDGMIRMEIHPELSKGEVREIGRFTIPEKQVTEVTTNVMVRDGSTVVIGGLMRDEVAVTKSQLPFLGNLPLVGFAFRSSTETTERQEVLVLITPHIVYEPDMGREGARAVAEFQYRHEVMGERLQPFNRRHVAQRYYRLARNAWARGDRQTALRQAEMAIHFLPGYQAAIDLRNAIWVGGPCDEAAFSQPCPMVEPHALGEPHVADWLFEEPGGQPQAAAPSGPVHPLDPGVPGPNRDISRPRKLP